MPGRTYNELFELATRQYGFVTTRDARELGIDPHRLAVMEQRGLVERRGHGLFRFPAVPPAPLDEFMEAALWPRGEGVICHETALDLHDLCDVNPTKIHVTVPKRFRLRRGVPAAYVFHRRDLRDDEKTLHEGIPVVTPLRAILDGIEIGLRHGLIDQAADTAHRRGLLRQEELELIAEEARSAPGEGVT